MGRNLDPYNNRYYCATCEKFYPLELANVKKGGIRYCSQCSGVHPIRLSKRHKIKQTNKL